MNLIDRIKTAAKKNDYAIGLPEKGKFKPFPKIKKPTPTSFVVHHHKAEKAGPHYDLRLQIPETTVGSSWAIPKAKLPGPGEKVLAVRQGDHRTSYFDFEGHIPKGYGKGQVAIAHKGPIEIIESRPDMVRFGVYHSRTPQEYLLRQTRGKNWMLMNTTPRREKVKLPETKYPYREIKPEKHNIEDDALHEAKIDGAHTFMVLDKGRQPRVFSYRRPKSGKTGLIEHSQKLKNWEDKVPKSLHGTVLVGETWGKQKGKNKPLRPETVGGILNSNVWRSRQQQEQLGDLQFSPFDVLKYKGKNVRDMPGPERKKIVSQIARKMDLELPDRAKTPAEKRKLWKRIRSGKHPQTQEGVIQWRDYPTKIKIRTDYDGTISGVYPARKGSKYQGRAVGGFYLTHDGTVSRVGTGLSDRLRKEMHRNPERFVGMTATVSAQEKLRSGKLRAPSFMRFHLDKNTPERLGKVQSLEKAASVWDLLRKNKALTGLFVGSAAAPLISYGLSRTDKNQLSTNEIRDIKKIFEKKYDLGKDFKLDVAEGHQPAYNPKTNTVQVPPNITAAELAHELGHAADYAAGDKSLIAKMNRGAIEQSYLWSDMAPAIGGVAGALRGPSGAAARMYGAAGIIPRAGRFLEEARAHIRGQKTMREQGMKPSMRENLSSLAALAGYAAPVAMSALLAARGIKTGADAAADHWDEMRTDQRQSDAMALGWHVEEMGDKEWSDLTPDQQEAYRKHYAKENPPKEAEYKDQIPGGLADKKKPSDFNEDQLRKGIKVELEHTDDRTKAREIAMDHLTEDPKYYDKLEKIEKHAGTPLFVRVKTAARWAEEMAAGRISPKDVERLRQAEGLGIRQIGKDPIGQGVEKVVHRAFGGEGLGDLVTKRIYNEISPEATKQYLDLAKQYPDLINAPVAMHEGGKGWIERPLGPLSPFRGDVRYKGHTKIPVEAFGRAGHIKQPKMHLSPELEEKFQSKLQDIGAKRVGNVQYGPQYAKNPTIELPGGMRLYDLHAGNIGLTPEGDPKLMDFIPRHKSEPYTRPEKVKKVKAKPVSSGTSTPGGMLGGIGKKLDQLGGQIKGKARGAQKALFRRLGRL